MTNEMFSKTEVQAIVDAAVRAALASLETPAPSAPVENKPCACWTLDGDRCAKHATKTRVIRGRTYDVCGTHGREEIAAFVTKKAALKHAADKEAAWQAIVDERREKARARSERKAQAPKQADTEYLTLANIADRIADLPTDVGHKVMGVTLAQWEAWVSDNVKDARWLEPEGIATGLYMGKRVGIVSRRGKQGRSADVKRGITVLA